MRRETGLSPERATSTTVPLNAAVHGCSVHAFTLIETLVVVSILSLLVSILLPALSAAREAAKTLQCSSNMRTIAVEFEFFASGNSEAGRGHSETLGESRFRINDFADSLYHVDEFWDSPDDQTGFLAVGDEPMLCPAGSPRLSKTRGLPCGREAVGPVEDVSLALNMRLYRAVVDFRGKRVLAPPASTVVSTRIRSHPYVPLVMDVDGREASRHGIDPFYIAPPLRDTTDAYSSSRYWLPAQRHNGKTIVAFVGGHVLRSAQPEKERWDWAYQAETR